MSNFLFCLQGLISTAFIFHVMIFIYIVYTALYSCLYSLLDLLLTAGVGISDKVHVRWIRYGPEKRAYIVTNAIKGVVLALNCIIHFNTFAKLVLYDEWDHNDYKMIAPAYACLDFTSLYYVYNMQIQTKLHHIGVMMAAFYISMSMTKNVASMLISYYAVTSAMAFHVNLYMGLRSLFSLHGSTIPKILGTLYAMTFFINLQYQLRVLVTDWDHVYWLLPVFGCFVYDDVHLIRWLMRTDYRTP